MKYCRQPIDDKATKLEKIQKKRGHETAWGTKKDTEIIRTGNKPRNQFYFF